MTRFGKILLTGVNGQVGQALLRSLAPLGTIVALDRSQLDLTNADSIRTVIRDIRPGLIVNPAAYTAVDQAESEPGLAYAVNAVAPGILAEEAARVAALLVHYSTDYVFDGAKGSAYVETDAPHALSVYGKSKLAGEQAIAAVGLPHLILRTSWVYGARGRNFLRTIIRLAQQRDSLRVVADQVGAPTSSHSIAAATAAILDAWDAEKTGIYHMSCAGKTSWHGFAEQILVDYAAHGQSRGWPVLKCRAAAVAPIPTREYPTPAVRPPNSLLDNGKLLRDFRVQLPPWRAALTQVMAELELD